MPKITVEPSREPTLQAARRVQLTVPQPSGDWRWEREAIGLLVAQVELGLGDFPGVLPEVDGIAAHPGAEGALYALDAPLWIAVLRVDGRDAEREITLSLCDPAGPCDQLTVRQPREQLYKASPALLALAQRQLGVSAPGAAEAWAEPVSRDDYAVLIAGRAAATFYGLLPPVPEVRLGDERLDPIARAVYIDPAMAVAWWLHGRREATLGDASASRQSFTRAAMRRPSSPAILADESAMLEAAGQPGAASAGWAELTTMFHLDGRYPVPHARSLLASKEPARADAAIQLALPAWEADPRVAPLRVAIADALNDAPDLDARLVAWQLADPTNAEPPRRRVALRVQSGQLAEARDLLPALSARGAVDEAARLDMSLSAGLADWARAAVAADQAGLLTEALRLRLRAAKAAGKQIAANALDADPTPQGALARARLALANGQPARAQAELAPLLKADPWHADALAAAAAAAKDAGEPAEQAKLLARLYVVDPSTRP